MVRAAGLLALAALVLRGRVVRPAWPLQPLAAATAAFVAALVASTALAVDVRAAVLGSEYRQHGLLTVLALVVLGVTAAGASRAGIERGLAVVAMASLPVAGYAIAQHQGLDPLPWAQDTALRVTGPLGHPGFLAAYLMMAVPIVLGRLTKAMADLRDSPGRPRAVLRAAFYAVVLVADGAAFVMAGRRGPWLALGVAVPLFFVVLGLTAGRRRLAQGAMGAALAGALALALLNLSGGPLKRLQESEGVGRLAHLLDAESGTVRGRVLIWGAAMDRVLSIQPLVDVHGGADPLAPLRPWIGFGPESFAPALLPFYPPELAHIEKEHPIPDRAHNDPLDAVTMGGLLGLLAYVAMVVAAFTVGGARLGLGRPRRVAATVGACGLGGAALGLAFGRAFAGVGLGLGLVAGFGLCLAVAALRDAGPRLSDGTVAASLLAALAGHLVETQFGIATMATRLLVAAILGWLVAEAATSGPASAESDGGAEDPLPARAAASLAGLLGLTVVYAFLRPGAGPGAWSVLQDALAATTPGALGVGAALALLSSAGAGLLVLETRRGGRPRAAAVSVVGALAVALGGGAALAWLVSSADGLSEPDAARRLAILPAVMLAAFVAAALAAGSALSRPPGAGEPAPGRVRLVLIGLATVAGLLVVPGFWSADVLLASARRLGDIGQTVEAVALHRSAARLAPLRDAIPAGAARVLAESARLIVSEPDRDAQFARADAELRQAEAEAPLSFAHAADRARLHLVWADLTVEPPLRQRRLARSDDRYRAALRLHPHSPGLWNEWAVLALAEAHPDEARQRLDHSLSLDPRLDQTHRLLREVDAQRN